MSHTLGKRPAIERTLKGFYTGHVGVQPLQGWSSPSHLSQGALLRRNLGL